MKQPPPEIDGYTADRRKRVRKKLEEYTASVREKHPGLADAVAHTLGSGKKIRPVLCMAACESVGGPAAAAMPPACAIEMIHTYSLIHDDLPAMDDDDTRRGLPSTHKKFGEATAILAGDLLLTDSFGVLVADGRAAGIADSVLLEMVTVISSGAGMAGMAVGQMMDLEGRGGEEGVHRLKTGALIEAAVRCGALAGGADKKQTAALAEYARLTGMAFQAVDDILDLGEAAICRNGKKRAGARERARELSREAVDTLDGFNGEKSVLAGLALFLCERKG